MHPITLLKPEINHLEPYTPIQPFEVLSQRLGFPVDQIVKLDANENPYGPIPAVAEALAEYPFYHIYPDPQQTKLRDALSRHLGVPASHIVPGHGADELLDILCRLFLGPGDAIINAPPTFGMYRFDARLQGAQVVEVWRRSDYSVDVEAVVAAYGDGAAEEMENPHVRPPKLLFLTSPNNPSGNWLPDDALRRMLELPVLVVLDEAYVEFSGLPSRAAWVLDHENMVVLRTFSKAAGIAGLRLGYGIFPAWLMPFLWQFKQPYNVNVAATVAALASLRNGDQMQAVVATLTAERERLLELLTRISYLRPYPSLANFILCQVVGRDARELKGTLERRGILVRYYANPGLTNCIRISVGRPDQTDRLAAALEALEGAAG